MAFAGETPPAAPFADLQGAYAWLDGQINHERALDRVTYSDRVFERDGFLRRLAAVGDPHVGLRTVHIAGTRGKGSCALILETLLRACGLRTAVFTSPHIHEYRERIRIDGAPLAPEHFTCLLADIAATGREGMPPPKARFKTVFENLTALFFLAARDAGVDWAIVETGLGGRLDATNVLEPGPVLLTRIGLEHTHLLGSTLGQIAGEKAAILKEGGWAVAGAQPGGQVDQVFRRRAREVGAPLDGAEELCPLLAVQARRHGLRVSVQFDGKPLDCELPILGPFQAENIQNALAMITRLRREGLVPEVPRERLARELGNLRLPGRLERLSTIPELIVDGGHCPTAAAALAESMRAHFAAEPAGLLVAMMSDKDHAGFFEALATWEGFRWVVCYPLDLPRAADPEVLARHARRHWPQARVVENLGQGLEALPEIAEKVDRVVATGTLMAISRLHAWAQADVKSLRSTHKDE